MDRGRPFYDLRTPKGRMRMYRVQPTVVLGVAEGQLELPQVQPVIDALTGAIDEAGTITMFHDWLEVGGYEPEVRVGWTTWSREQRAQITATHILVASRVVAMGVRTAALALSLVGARLYSYSEPERFNAALANAGARARRGA